MIDAKIVVINPSLRASVAAITARFAEASKEKIDLGAHYKGNPTTVFIIDELIPNLREIASFDITADGIESLRSLRADDRNGWNQAIDKTKAWFISNEVKYYKPIDKIYILFQLLNTNYFSGKALGIFPKEGKPENPNGAIDLHLIASLAGKLQFDLFGRNVPVYFGHRSITISGKQCAPNQYPATNFSRFGQAVIGFGDECYLTNIPLITYYRQQVPPFGAIDSIHYAKLRIAKLLLDKYPDGLPLEYTVLGSLLEEVGHISDHLVTLDKEHTDPTLEDSLPYLSAFVKAIINRNGSLNKVHVNLPTDHTKAVLGVAYVEVSGKAKRATLEVEPLLSLYQWLDHLSPGIPPVPYPFAAKFNIQIAHDSMTGKKSTEVTKPSTLDYDTLANQAIELANFSTGFNTALVNSSKSEFNFGPSDFAELINKS